jgi:hypothetical protein
MELGMVFILAEAAKDNSSFSGFQTAFFEAWDFVIPNIIVLILCIAVAKIVGRHNLAWLRVPPQRIRTVLTSLRDFLRETGLFGSKVFPAIIVLAVFIATLDIFQAMRSLATNLIPPTLRFSPTNLYARLADDDLLIRLLVQVGGVAPDYHVYDQIFRWEEEMRNGKEQEKNQALKSWDENGGKWAGREGDVKLLAAVAIISCVVGIFQRRWRSLFRLVWVLGLLGIAFTFCLAKELYAREQASDVVLASLGQHLREQDDSEVRSLFRKRAAGSSWVTDWITAPRPPANRPWWEFEMIDTYFFKRLTYLFTGQGEQNRERPPLLTKEELDWLKTREESRSAKSGNSATEKASEADGIPRSK